MSTSPVRKAYAYILRERTGSIEVLVFRHRDYPEAGVQVPKGGVEPGEAPADAAVREVEEEVGLCGMAALGEVGRDLWTDAAGNEQERHFFAFRAPANTPDSWDHAVRSAGEDNGLVFLCSWLAVSDAHGELVPGHGAYLDRAVLLLMRGPRLSFSAFTPADVAAMSTWRYEGRYAVYSAGADPDESADEMLDRRSPHFAVRDSQRGFVGFFAYGTACEPWNHQEPALYANDARMLAIGLGMRPDLTGHGCGLDFVRAGLAFAAEHFAPAAYRLYVYPWNARAIRVYERAGFAASGTISLWRERGVEETFLEMRRPVEA